MNARTTEINDEEETLFQKKRRRRTVADTGDFSGPMVEPTFSAVEFQGKPVEYWESYARQKGPIPQKLSGYDKWLLDYHIHDSALHKNVARIAHATEGYATLLTTSGQVLQIQPARPAWKVEGYPEKAGQKAAIVISPNLDRKGVELLMQIYAQDGFPNMTAAEIPFGKSTNGHDDKKDRIRKLWNEIRADQQKPAAEPFPQRPRHDRQHAPAA